MGTPSESLPHDFTPPPAEGATGDVMGAYSKIWRCVQAAVEREAYRLGDDHDEREELIQVARLELWRIDPSRCDITDPRDVAFLKGMLRKGMSDAAAKLRGENSRSEEVPADLLKQLRMRVVDENALERE